MTKTVLITGASRGLGLQFTAHYVKAGWKVIATARSLASADELNALAPWKSVALDASNEESISAAARELQGVAIDLVINNAGILTSNGTANSTKADIMQQFEVNAVGPFLVTRALLPNLMLAAQANGYAMVSQITSRMGSIALNENGGYIGYRASKTALNMISTSLAKDLAEHKIGVVLLHPGYVSTDMCSGVGDITPQQSIQYLTTILDRVDLKDSSKFFHYEGRDHHSEHSAPKLTREGKPKADSNMLTSAQQRIWLSATSATCAGLSIIGSVYILARYWYVRSWASQAAAASSPRRAIRRIDVTQELIHVLAWFDLIGALGRSFGHSPARTFDQSKREPVTAVCQLQAFAISFSDVSAIVWNFLMALNLYRWVCLGEDQQRLTKTIKWYIVGTLLFTTTIITPALAAGVYGDARVWCWIALPDDRFKDMYWKLGCLYFWIMVLAVAMAVLLILVKMNVQRRLQDVDNEDARAAYKSVVHTLTIYIVAFIVCWTPPMVNRTYTWATQNSRFTLEMLHVSIVSLQGFVNAVIYGKFHIWLLRRIPCRSMWTQEPKPVKPSESSMEQPPGILPRRRQDPLQVGIASIFVTTFDMNWAPFPRNLTDWIPVDKDVYVFTLQHCMGVQLVEQAIREYLLRVNFPMGYRSITSLSGSRLRGDVEDATICQMIFVNNHDVASGNFQCKAGDRRQWAQWKANKDVVGIPIRYFDSSIAFVSCNLETSVQNDSLGTKSAAVSSLLRSFSMGVDRSAVEFPHLYHHTFLSGVLNFGVALPHGDLASTIDRAYKAECLKRATDTATHVKLQGLGTTPQTRPRNLIRESHARTSTTSRGSDEGDEEYHVVSSESHDGLSFTLLQSPLPSSCSRDSAFSDRSSLVDHIMEITVNEDSDQCSDDDSPRQSRSAWLGFLDRILPTTSARKDHTRHSLTRTSISHDLYSPVPSPQHKSKVARASVANARFAAECSHSNWHELVQHDELRVAMQAREVLSGFEEPPITFLPSYPRRVGVAASYLIRSGMGGETCFDASTQNEPAYVDRILLHSLPDTRKRIRNVSYWLCEKVTTSTHKPVCSEYELEVDRFFAYNSNEASATDVQAGNVALRDKTDIHEFKIKLVNLDVNMWTYRATAPRPSSMNPLRRLRSPSFDGAPVPDQLSAAGGNSPGFVPDKRATSTRRLESRSQASQSGGSTHSQSHSHRSKGESFDNPQLDLIPVEPSQISTVFPLPSEDVYALQRKVYEVVHSVQKGFLSSSRDGKPEESSLAYTNSRTVSWRDASAHGVSHSAIMKPVNGVLHVAINVESDVKGQGGQGILCIEQPQRFTSDLEPSQDEKAETSSICIPFDIPLTWGGRHVGYLHGDVVTGF